MLEPKCYLQNVSRTFLQRITIDLTFYLYLLVFSRFPSRLVFLHTHSPFLLHPVGHCLHYDSAHLKVSVAFLLFFQRLQVNEPQLCPFSFCVFFHTLSFCLPLVISSPSFLFLSPCCYTLDFWFLLPRCNQTCFGYWYTKAMRYDNLHTHVSCSIGL